MTIVAKKSGKKKTRAEDGESTFTEDAMITNALFGSIAEPASLPPAKSSARRLRRSKTPAGVKERLLADVLENPQKYPDWRQDSAMSAAVDLLKQRDRLEGKPSARISPQGGLERGLTCSSTWFTDNWEGTEQYPLGAPYPPGGDQTSMVRCRRCGTLAPPIAIGPHECLDCLPVEAHTKYGASASAQPFIIMAGRSTPVEMLELPECGQSALRREIARYRATGRLKGQDNVKRRGK